jgi:hypothetical protein
LTAKSAVSAFTQDAMSTNCSISRTVAVPRMNGEPKVPAAPDALT